MYKVQLTEKLNITNEWDKTFLKSDKAKHQKVQFVNRFGITLVGDLYSPKEDGVFSAIAVASPYGAVKEQAGGYYANELASRGFVTLVFDPSFTGAIDYLETLNQVDSNKIGVLGVCGWGCYTFPLAAMDNRIKAVVSATMGVFDTFANGQERIEGRKTINEIRSKLANGEDVPKIITVPDIDENSPDFMKDYYAYYRTNRGFHPRSINSGCGWNPTTFLSHYTNDIYAYANEVTQPCLLVHGDKAWSYQQSVLMMDRLVNVKDKELFTVKNATHCDLYDGGENHDKIPFDKIEDFFKKNLK